MRNKVFILILLLLVLAISVGVEARSRTIRVKVLDNITTATETQTASSSAVDISRSSGFLSLHVIISGTTPKIKFQYTVAPVSTATYLTPAAASDVIAECTANYAVYFQPVLTPLLKVKYTGNAGNSTDTNFTAYLFYTVEE